MINSNLIDCKRVSQRNYQYVLNESDIHDTLEPGSIALKVPSKLIAYILETKYNKLQKIKKS